MNRIGLFFLAAAAMLTTACGSTKPPQAIDLRLWTHWDGRELEILRGEIESFEKDRPSVRVHLTVIPFETFSSELEQALRRGGAEAPDVFTGINDWIGNFSEKNLILPIDDLPRESPNDFLPYAYEACRRRDRLYAFPISYECISLFYNRAFVKTPPVTHSEWILAARRLTDPARGVWGIAVDLSKAYFVMPWLIADGESLLRADGSPALDSADKIKWLERVRALQDADGVVPPRTSGMQDDPADLFASGKAAFFIGGPWDIPRMAESGVNFAVTRLPKNSAGRWLPPLIGVKALFLTGKGDKPASRDLIRHLGRATLQRKFAVGAARIPSLKIVYDDPAILQNRHLMAFADQASVGEPMPTDPEMFAVWQPLRDLAFVPYLEGKTSARKGLAAAQKAAESEIARYLAEKAAW